MRNHHSPLPLPTPRPRVASALLRTGLVQAALARGTAWTLVVAIVGHAVPSVARTTAEAPPAFLGVARRPDVASSEVAPLEAALTRALGEQGVTNLTGQPVAWDRASAVEGLRGKIKDASKRLAASDESGAQSVLDQAMKTFEEGLAFSDDTAAWDLYRDLMTTRVVVLAKLKQQTAADDTLMQLLAIDPSYTPEKRSPPELSKTYKRVSAKAGKSKTSIEVTSSPPGAEVVVDGRAVGNTPFTVQDARPGIHFVSISLAGERVTQKVLVGRARARANAKLLSTEGREAVRALVHELGEPRLPIDLEAQAAKVGADTMVAVLVKQQDDVDAIVARIEGGKLVAVVGARAGGTPEERAKSASLLAEAISLRRDDVWLDAGRRAGLPREVLVGARVAAAAPAARQEEGGSALPWIIGGSVAGAVVLAAAGAGIAYFFVVDDQRNKGFTWSVNVSQLQ